MGNEKPFMLDKHELKRIREMETAGNVKKKRKKKVVLLFMLSFITLCIAVVIGINVLQFINQPQIMDEPAKIEAVESDEKKEESKKETKEPAKTRTKPPESTYLAPKSAPSGTGQESVPKSEPKMDDDVVIY
ncbi:MAG: hypothetical protein LBL41_04355 [Bifidobacteriaceae bacterium]|jgi:cytoskeletal protein RodZ|nr:hypothetical protein [Bifidobacteriaceae bacterium]